MKKYLVYTTEGYCEAPDGSTVENCQMLGAAKAESSQEAIQKFFNNNQFFRLHGFTPNKANAIQLDDNQDITWL